MKSEFRYSFVSETDGSSGVVVASEPFLALRFASGVFAHRTITGYRESYDATRQLREFCRWCAAKMLPHWPQAPALFLEWAAENDSALAGQIARELDANPPRFGVSDVLQMALNAQVCERSHHLVICTWECAFGASKVLHDVEPVRDEFNRLIANGFE